MKCGVAPTERCGGTRPWHDPLEAIERDAARLTELRDGMRHRIAYHDGDIDAEHILALLDRLHGGLAEIERQIAERKRTQFLDVGASRAPMAAYDDALRIVREVLGAPPGSPR